MKNRNILVVEDEKKIADTLKMGLKENGYAVEVAYDGRQGLNLFEKQPFNLIILDINLPGIGGYDLCKMIRKENGNIPIIMLTALSTLEDKVEGYTAGADDYLSKPFQFTELLMKTRVLLKRTLPEPPGAVLLKVGELEMNLETKEVKRAGKKINLTAKEFQLLEYLMRNKNKVLSRSDIAINVWDINFDTNTNVIDVYINYLRNKVDKMFETKYIQTQVGMGYVLKENP
ncbi:MAG: response regulator transcription factor [Candidatus Dadabacteria bacterium]